MPIVRTSILAAAAMLGAGSVAFAGTVVLTPSADNTLFEPDPGMTDDLSNGQGDYIFAGVTARGARRRVLLKFDVSAAVPAGAVITEVQLALRCSFTISTGQYVTLHRAQNAWGEGASNAPAEEGGGANAFVGDATWLYRIFDTITWATPGGDFIAAPHASKAVGDMGLTYTWGSTPEMVADAQYWLENPASNFGWVVLGNESEFATAKRFNSRENPDAASRPQLTIVFVDPPSCNADYNQDGGGDNSDIIDLANDIASGTQSYPGSDPDFNQDGGADNADVVALADRIAGGPCP